MMGRPTRASAAPSPPATCSSSAPPRANSPRCPLDDALRIALLMARTHDPHYEPAAIRWLARLCLERPTIGFDDLTHLLAAFEALPTQPTEAWAALTMVCAHHEILTSAGPA